MTKTGCSYGAVEDPRGGRCYGRDTATTTTSHTSTNSKHDGVGMVSDGPDLRQCEDEARPSGKRRAAFGTGVVMIVLASSMVVGYVFGLTVASVTEEEGVDVLLADTADARDRTSFTGREFTMEDEADEEHEELFSFRSLSLEARNEYGVFDALALYGLDMVVEPYKETTLSAVTMEWTTPDSSFGDGPVGCGSWRRKSSWVLTRLDDKGTPIPDAPPLLNITLDVDDDQDGGEGYYGGGGALSGGGERIDGPTITLTEGGTQYLLVVTEMFEDGEVIGEGRATVSCRYVRRELRELTTGDRDAFMDAMVEFYTAPTVVTAGGPDDRNYQYFAAVHDAKEFCYHNGMMFLTAHLAFDWEMEKELQKINPAVSLAFWDYTIESGTLGADWPQSEIFGPSMFGSALGSEDNGFMVSDGRFANVSSIYDPKSLLTSADITPVTNSYGYVSAKYDYQDVEKLSRTHSFCGFTGTTAFPQCEAVIRCFDDNKSLQAWSTCMEDNIHADMHGWLGGAWGCETDMGHFKEEHPEFSDDLLVFVLQFATASRWSTNALFDDYNECDTACTRGSPEPCGCHCLVNPATMSNDEVYTALEHVMVVYSTIFNADYFIYHDRSAKYEYNFMQDGVPLTDKEFMLLLRFILTVGCKPANIGAMSTGASPTDPLFWMIHPMFERALHVLWLSPEYKDTYDFSWTGSGCYGSALTDNLPFTEKSLGQGSGTSFLTNEDILRIAHPSNSKLPYLYNNFDTWGTCTDWNPCPDCV
eukprot:jgi/Undpi1/11094/HiC_scaffold_30.g13392.m1